MPMAIGAAAAATCRICDVVQSGAKWEKEYPSTKLPGTYDCTNHETALVCWIYQAGFPVYTALLLPLLKEFLEASGGLSNMAALNSSKGVKKHRNVDRRASKSRRLSWVT
eukprot:376878-Pelagomonas_calceolata.AAC.3